MNYSGFRPTMDHSLRYHELSARSKSIVHSSWFIDAIPAFKARRLGNAILTEAMNRDGRMSFDSYDRFFPNQDRMPEGGFGNLVALPLQGKARRNLNSVFVDDDFLAYKDQWAYLSQAGRISESFVDSLLQLHNHEELGRLSTSSERQPWVTPLPESITPTDFDTSITITLADKIYIPLKSLSAKVLNHIKRIAAFRNPDFYSKQAMRMSTYGVPRVISCFDITDHYLAMPRGCIEPICRFLDDNHAKYDIVDIQVQPAEGQIFNGRTFFRPFRKDIASAKKSIVISSPRLYLSNKIELLDTLRELSARGVEVVIMTNKENEHTILARGKGLDVRIMPSLSLHCSIIDKSTLWYGDVNFLGYSSEEQNVIKVEDQKLATEILGVLYTM